MQRKLEDMLNGLYDVSIKDLKIYKIIKNVTVH